MSQSSSQVDFQRLSIGIGCSSRATSDDVLALIKSCVKEVFPDTVLATLDSRSRMGEAVANLLGLPLMLFSASTLALITGTTIESSLALRSSGTRSVAEASALAALGPQARLVVTRHTGRLCTCAVAVLP